jgi:hypothetical protein
VARSYENARKDLKLKTTDYWKKIKGLAKLLTTTTLITLIKITIE